MTNFRCSSCESEPATIACIVASELKCHAHHYSHTDYYCTNCMNSELDRAGGFKPEDQWVALHFSHEDLA